MRSQNIFNGESKRLSLMYRQIGKNCTILPLYLMVFTSTLS